MNLDSLRLYCNVVRAQSFSRGAVESGVTQSAASQAVFHLEEELGALLLDRSKRPFAVTAEGEKFYEACLELLDGFERVRDQIAGHKNEVSGVVRVAAIYSVGLHDMGTQMQKFRFRYPEARVRLECLHPETVVKSVLDDLADVGILSYPPSKRALKVVPLRSERMQLVCHPGHRLARRRRVKCQDLAGEPFVAFDEDLAIRKAVDRALRQRDVFVDVVVSFDNIESIKKAVSNELGVSILPVAATEKEVAIQTLRSIPLDAELSRPVGLIHRRNKVLSQATTRFIAMLSDDYR